MKIKDTTNDRKKNTSNYHDPAKWYSPAYNFYFSNKYFFVNYFIFFAFAFGLLYFLYHL